MVIHSVLGIVACSLARVMAEVTAYYAYAASLDAVVIYTIMAYMLAAALGGMAVRTLP
jgi:hypothetical protein